MSVSTIAWITFTQLAAAGMGGYLAGRLRLRWDGLHNDEVYFRDTAQGFLAWAVATLATAAILKNLLITDGLPCDYRLFGCAEICLSTWSDPERDAHRAFIETMHVDLSRRWSAAKCSD